eukprot:UN07378
MLTEIIRLYDDCSLFYTRPVMELLGHISGLEHDPNGRALIKDYLADPEVKKVLDFSKLKTSQDLTPAEMMFNLKKDPELAIPVIPSFLLDEIAYSQHCVDIYGKYAQQITEDEKNSKDTQRTYDVIRYLYLHEKRYEQSKGFDVPPISPVERIQRSMTAEVLLEGMNVYLRDTLIPHEYKARQKLLKATNGSFDEET